MSERQEFGIVIVHYSGFSDLEACLASVITDVAGTDVLVVHTGADSRVQRRTKEYNVGYVPLPSNPGYGAALNVGLAYFPKRTVLCANSDLLFSAGSIRFLAELASLANGICFPLQQSPEGSAPHPDSLLDQLSVGDTVRRWLGIGRKRRLRQRARLVADLAVVRATYKFNGIRYSGSGACFAIAAAPVIALGGIPEQFFLQEEDRLLCWKAARQSIPLLLVGGITVTHLGGMRGERPGLRKLCQRRKVELEGYRQRRGSVPLIVQVIIALGLLARVLACAFFWLHSIRIHNSK